MALVLIPSSASAGTSADLAALETQVAAAKATADAAVAAAANARQMVLNRDGTLASLSQTASQFGSVTKAADMIHQQLQDEITELQGDLQVDLTLLAEAAMQ